MTTELLTRNIWPQLTKASQHSSKRCTVAVAYFGKGANRLLPLAKGSRLVVDASERSVACGNTCPTELMKLVKRGVDVYSVPNLHAKVFVLGRAAYIGSANVSSHSASQLLEAVMRTSEPNMVRAARTFVEHHCLHQLTPKVLERLSKLYHPPRIPGGKPSRHRRAITSEHPSLPRLFLAHLHLEDWSEQDQALHDEAMDVAKKHRKHPRSFELDSFRQTGKCFYRRGDVIVQVTDEGKSGILVTPPGNVLHVRTRRDRNRRVSFIYVECPDRRRRQIKALTRTLRCPKKRLLRDGVIRDLAFAQALMNAWAVKL